MSRRFDAFIFNDDPGRPKIGVAAAMVLVPSKFTVIELRRRCKLEAVLRWHC